MPNPANHIPNEDLCDIIAAYDRLLAKHSNGLTTSDEVLTHVLEQLKIGNLERKSPVCTNKPARPNQIAPAPEAPSSQAKTVVKPPQHLTRGEPVDELAMQPMSIYSAARCEATSWDNDNYASTGSEGASLTFF